MSKKLDKFEEAQKTTGHEWDGIRELDTPMPRWWLWTFYATIIWGIGYVIAYPAWPLVNGATAGLLGYSSRGAVAADIQRVNDENASLDQALVSVELTGIVADQDLSHYATAGGSAVFKTNCIQCHGAGASGFVGYPNLLDDDWLWGGDLDAIYATVSHGIRSEADEDTRLSDMPAFGEFLEEAEIDTLVSYVSKISGQEHDGAGAELGSAVFAENCSSCHMETGVGDRELGAPDLTDAIWLYGGDPETLKQTITYSRSGVMPHWTGRLSEAQIRQVTVYVHQLGGGE